MLISIGKRAGLDLPEINEFRVRDLLDYVHTLTGDEEDGDRMATQEDIDRFYAR